VQSIEDTSLYGDDEAHVFEHRIVRPDGAVRWIEVRILLLETPASDQPDVAGVSIDITDRKRLEQELEEAIEARDRLMQEIHHRVKNNFQLASSILGLQRRATDDENVRQILADVRARIQSMVSLHRILYQQDDLEQIEIKSYLESIIESVRENFRDSHGSVTVRQTVDDIRLTPEKALIVGLILTELLMDSYEHAMPRVNEGTITSSPGPIPRPSSSPRQGNRSGRTRCGPSVASAWQGTKCPNTWSSGTNCRATPRARSSGRNFVRDDWGHR
jgi:hypothetical protein